MITAITISIIVFILIVGPLAYKASRVRAYNSFDPIAPVSEVKQKDNYVYDNEPKEKYPLFIPFYEYHGFFKGLHWENKLFYRTRGKQGRCPRKLKNPF